MRSDGVRTTVIVITWRGRAHIDACLNALSTQSRPHRTLVVDNASDDGTPELLAAHPDVEVLRLPRNLGYAGGLAAVLPRVDTPFVAWLNDDAAPAPDWLEVVEGNLSRSTDAAAATSVLLTPEGDVQSTGVRLTADGHGADATGTGEVFGFCGGAALLRTDVLRAVGGVPAEFFCYYEDTDTAWRLRLAGFKVVRTGATVTHLHGASTRPGSALFHRWNEGNRLLTLLRCAPAAVAVRELARFAAISLLLPWRGLPHPPPNLRAGLRLRVLLKVALLLPVTLRARWRIRRAVRVSRREVWQVWAGR